MHFLAAASLQDASATLEKDYFSPVTLAFLYSWMVQNSQDSSSFAIFATALRRFESKFADVSLVQSFISRSLYNDKDIETTQTNSNFDDDSEL